jgi:hypothetical protein
MSPSSTAPNQPPDLDAWLRECWAEGVTTAASARLCALTDADLQGADDDVRAGLGAFAALAAMGHGDYDRADRLLSGRAGTLSPPVMLLDSAARLYRACGDAERDPARALLAMNDLAEVQARVQALTGGAAGVGGPALSTAQAYAGLSLAEALLMVGDVGAARHQLSLIIEEGAAPPALLTMARCILSGIEQAVGRADLAIDHMQAAVRATAGLPAEGMLTRLLLCGMMLGADRLYGLALYDEFLARHGRPAGHGAVARLFRMLDLMVPGLRRPDDWRSEPPLPSPYPLAVRTEIREHLRFLQGRHYSPGWFVLFTGLCAGVLRAAGDPCEAYTVLVHAAATLRLRHMDGAAEMCDRQIEVLRVELGVDRFEALLVEARQRRQLAQQISQN